MKFQNIYVDGWECDGLNPYGGWFGGWFGGSVDFGQLANSLDECVLTEAD